MCSKIEDGFSSTEELIKFVKKEFGHDFTIAVTGKLQNIKTWGRQ
jgi:hypothetical protein